jgi:DNA-binding SARP family transcriptional activator
MEFRILGPLRVFDDARPLGPKQRSVLVHLILRVNHTVGADRRPTAT